MAELQQPKPWHRLSVAAASAALATGPDGLAPAEAEARLVRYGANELQEQRRRSPLRMILAQFSDFMILVLLGAAVVAGSIGDLGDAAPIVAIVILNALIGFAQEYRAEKAMAALKKMSGQTALVRRAGQPQPLPAAAIVPGDLVLLEAGNIVPADLRLVEVHRLQADEAALTGESLPSDKDTVVLSDEHLSLGDRRNMAYKGTTVTYGRGAGIAVATGAATELGAIATLLQAEGESRTPLQRRLATFGQRLALLILLVCALIFAVGYLRGEPPLLMFLTAVSLAVAAIPEALPAVVTISLALGAAKMVRQNALIRRLPAVETLGSVTYICSDKTGTLTLNRMTVAAVQLDGSLVAAAEPPAAEAGEGGAVPASPRALLLAAAALCNDVHRNLADELAGDPTEIALTVLAQQWGGDRDGLLQRFPRVAEIPFEAERKCMTTVHRWEDGYLSFTKGAVDVLLDRSAALLTAAGPIVLVRQGLLQAGEEMARQGLRVLCLAMRRWDSLPAELTPKHLEAELTVLGLVGLQDPPRPEAREAVTLCRSAGITPVMITGDHPETARSIATQLGILATADDGVITGRQLEEIAADDFRQVVERTRVYARVAPAQKLQIVTALQEKGEFVAMTGDGVNDAPALKRADIGIAMGITGTDVAKESSAMILLDDNFATIVKAVREGRRIFANILKFITYSITGNTGTLVAITLAPFFGLPLTLLPIQILWLNLLTDSLPGLALAAEPAEGDVMRQPPRPTGEGIFSARRGAFITVCGIGIGAMALLLQEEAQRRGLPWQTMVFTFLVAARMMVALAVRSERNSLTSVGVLRNRPLLAALLVTAGLHLGAVYLPFANRIFATEPLSGIQQAVILLAALAVLLFLEGYKWLVYRVGRSKPA